MGDKHFSRRQPINLSWSCFLVHKIETKPKQKKEEKMEKIRKERLVLPVILLGLLVVGLAAIGGGIYFYFYNKNLLFPVPYSVYICLGLIAEGLFALGLLVKIFKSI